MRLKDAVTIVYKGKLGVSALKTEAANGRLTIEKTANKDFVTLRNIQEMRKLCRVGKAPRSLSLKSSEQETGTGISDTSTGRSRQAAINHWLKETGQQIGRFSIWMPPNPPPREEWFTRSEAAQMLWSMYKMREKQGLSETSRRTQLHVVRFVVIALYTGTRSGAIFGLRWMPSTDSGWIDLENGLIYREGQRSKQTNKRQTPVKVPPRLLAHLRRWCSIDKNPAGYVANFNGKRIKSIKTAWNKAKGVSNIPKSHTPHTLRHTRATWLMQKGVPTWEAASSLGMTVQQLEPRYGHHHPDFQKNATNAY